MNFRERELKSVEIFGIQLGFESDDLTTEPLDLSYDRGVEASLL